ncbi:MAG: M28 family peptidase [Phycisphaeraceae bacterium]|nr:M28 family peptidase [Phycisphaeraceae bacterium]
MKQSRYGSEHWWAMRSMVRISVAAAVCLMGVPPATAQDDVPTVPEENELGLPGIPYLKLARPELGVLTDDTRALATELRRDVEMLATDIGPRGTFAPERYALAADFLMASLKKAGYEPRKIAVECHLGPSFNIEALLPGTEHPERVIVIGAHYDSVEGCPAANDNASGVAGVLAMARALREAPHAYTIRFMLYANEEPPHFNFNGMGSQIDAASCRKAGMDIRAMFCLETIGCYRAEKKSQTWPNDVLAAVLPSTGDFIAFVGMEGSKPAVRACAEAFTRTGAFPLLAASVPPAIQMAMWSDHRGYDEAGYPAFMVTDTAPLRYPHYHKATDTAEKLDYDSMARVVEGLIGMMRDGEMRP